MEKRQGIRVLTLVLALAGALLLCLGLSQTARADDTPLTAPTEYLFDPEYSWCYQKIGELYGEPYAALYRVVLETADDYVRHRENYTAQDVRISVDELRRRGVDLDMIDKDLAKEYLKEAVEFELSTVVDFAILTLDQAPFNPDSLWVYFAQTFGEPEMGTQLLDAATEALADAGFTAENLESLSDQEKALRIHDALTARIDYRWAAYNQQAYGGLVKIR